MAGCCPPRFTALTKYLLKIRRSSIE
jgi:hypothetical protein